MAGLHRSGRHPPCSGQTALCEHGISPGSDHATRLGRCRPAQLRLPGVPSRPNQNPGTWKARIETLMESETARQGPQPAPHALGRPRAVVHIDMVGLLVVLGAMATACGVGKQAGPLPLAALGGCLAVRSCHQNRPTRPPTPSQAGLLLCVGGRGSQSRVQGQASGKGRSCCMAGARLKMLLLVMPPCGQLAQACVCYTMRPPLTGTPPLRPPAGGVPLRLSPGHGRGFDFQLRGAGVWGAQRHDDQARMGGCACLSSLIEGDAEEGWVVGAR